MDSTQLANMIQCIKAMTARHPSMRKNAAVLARDIAAVWTGLRAAVMVDYMLLSSSSMLAVLKSLATGNSQGPRLIVLHLDGCLYLVHRDTLQMRYAALRQPTEATAVFVGVDAEDKSTLAKASAQATQEVCRQLANVCEKALSAESQSGEQHQVCDLDGVEDIPIMPTVSGWLLRYPVVYLADAQTAPTLASLLSQASLQLYQMQAGGTLIKCLHNSRSMLMQLSQNGLSCTQGIGKIAKHMVTDKECCGAASP